MTTVVLNEHEFVRISGPDARSFLQGQVSCNVDLLTPQRSLHGALCNLKGRVIADFRLLQQGDDCLLQTGAGMAERVIATLAKYAVFSKVQISREDNIALASGVIDENCGDLAGLGVAVPAEFDAVSQSADLALIRIPGCSLRCEAWCFTAAGAALFEEKMGACESLPLSAWQREDLRAGIVHVTPALSEQYTPQLLNYDISGVIDFKKGCYTGQEVVARMYYRGKPKQRMFLLHSSVPVSADSKLVQELDGDSRDGEILAYSNGDGEPDFLLAVLDTALVSGSARFRLAENTDSELTLVPLPYSSEE